MKTQYLFVPLAMNQTLFYEKMAVELKNQGFDVCFICFHERSHHYLTQKGFVSYNPYREAAFPEWNNHLTSDFEQLVKRYGLTGGYHLLTHEQVAYGLKDQKEPIQKYVWTLRNLEIIFEKYLKGTKTVVMQELGGFASVISTYFVTRTFGFEHFFIEPSYFKGRYFLIHNSFGPVSISSLADVSSPEVIAKIQAAQGAGEIVIPFKDRAHYLNLFEKVFNIYNFKRFYQKVSDKYILGYFEEFRYISGFTQRHLKAFINKRRLKKYYQTDINTNRPFIYFPLHVPLDVAITFRSPVFKDQMALLDLLCRSCPLGYDIVFKEHPAMVGVINSSEVLVLLKKYNNLRIMHPTVNNYKVLKEASILVTVNSKSGAEALSLGKNVIVLGDAFYTKSPLVHELRNLSQLNQKINEVLAMKSVESDKIYRYFTEVWNHSNAGDIYVLDDQTIRSFVKKAVEILN